MTQSYYKLILYFILVLIFSITNFGYLSGQNERDDGIVVVYPKKNQIVNPQEGSCLILGRISKKYNQLFINGEKVDFDLSDRTFLHYGKIILPTISDSLYLHGDDLLEGYFLIELADSKYKDSIHYPVKIKKPLRTLPEDIIRIDSSFPIQPSEDLILSSGEVLEIKFKATPNCKAFFSIEGYKDKYPLVETYVTNQFYLGEAVFGRGFIISKDTVKGIYSGHLIIPNENWKDRKIKIFLEHEKLGKKEFTIESRISIRNSNQFDVVRILEDPNLVIGRTGPMLGYRLFLPEGVKAICDGKREGFYRLRLSSNQTIFVPENSVEFLPQGTPPPKSTIEVIRVEEEDKFVCVRIGLHEKLPYEINHILNPHTLKLKIYNVKSNIDWIFFDADQKVVKNIWWNQINDDELEIAVELNQKQLFGYYVNYENDILTLRIKKTPEIEKRFLFFGKPLKNKIIVLDPGHNPEDGAVGPSGLKEKDINLILAKITKEVLEKEGAKVFLTREDESLLLRQRKERVLSFQPDFSISIHNNAVPDGVNPLIHNGLSIYYYNQNAREFAYILHKKMKENLSLPDFGLYWDNLYMCRIPETIAILVEPTFIIHPEQEKLLKQENFQYKFAETIKDALIEFLEGVRE